MLLETLHFIAPSLGDGARSKNGQMHPYISKMLRFELQNLLETLHLIIAFHRKRPGEPLSGMLRFRMQSLLGTLHPIGTFLVDGSHSQNGQQKDAAVQGNWHSFEVGE